MSGQDSLFSSAERKVHSSIFTQPEYAALRRGDALVHLGRLDLLSQFMRVDPPLSFSRNYDLILYFRITWLYFCPFCFSLPLSFPPWNAFWAWPCESSLPHWPHQSSLSSPDAPLTQISHTLLRHSPLVWPLTTGRLFLLSCHVSRDVRALLCVWLADVFATFPVCGRCDVGDRH